MIARDELLTYCNELLSVNLFKDYCPNGLQVEGTEKIERIISGVTASQALIEVASGEFISMQRGIMPPSDLAHGRWRHTWPINSHLRVNLSIYRIPRDATDQTQSVLKIRLKTSSQASENPPAPIHPTIISVLIFGALC